MKAMTRVMSTALALTVMFSEISYLKANCPSQISSADILADYHAADLKVNESILMGTITLNGAVYFIKKLSFSSPDPHVKPTLTLGQVINEGGILTIPSVSRCKYEKHWGHKLWDVDLKIHIEDPQGDRNG